MYRPDPTIAIAIADDEDLPFDPEDVDLSDLILWSGLPVVAPDLFDFRPQDFVD